jgi:inosine/xanthosine triphosphate pyrophosphatase family protein
LIEECAIVSEIGELLSSFRFRLSEISDLDLDIGEIGEIGNLGVVNALIKMDQNGSM